MARKKSKLTGTATEPVSDLDEKRSQRQKVRKRAVGFSAAKLKARSKAAEPDSLRSRVLARMLENRTLGENWRDEARGPKEGTMFKPTPLRDLMLARQNPEETEALTQAQAAAKEYRARRAEMLEAARRAEPGVFEQGYQDREQGRPKAVGPHYLGKAKKRRKPGTLSF